MSAMTAILNRELVARRDLLLVAAAAAGIALLMPLMPGLEGYGAADVRNVSSNVLALVIGWGMAVGLGASIFGSDLSHGRLGFFFARPVRGLSVWLGRIGAVLLLVCACELLVLLPSLVGGWANIFNFNWADGWEPVVVFGVVPVLLVLLSHAVSIVFRARTAWLFLDLAGLVAVGVAGWFSVRPFVFQFTAKDAIFVIAGALTLAIGIGLLVAGAAGVIIGRTDLRRAHGSLSLTLWTVLAFTVGSVTAYSVWLSTFEPADLERVDVLSVHPKGTWIEVEGTASGHLDVRRRFLISGRDTRWIALPNAFRYEDGLSFSKDGSRAVWVGSGLGEKARFVQFADLDLPHPELIATTLAVRWGIPIELSPDGSTLAMVEEGTLSFYELAGERLMKVVRLPDDLTEATMFFDGPDTLRLYARIKGGEQQGIRIAEVAIPTGELTRTGEIGGLPGRFWTVFDSGLERMVVGASRDGVESESWFRGMYDARSGEFIRDFPRIFPRFLSDGRILSLRKGDDGSFRVHELFPEERVLSIPDSVNSEEARFGGEMLPGQVAVSRQIGTDGYRRVMRTDLVDVDSGVITPIGEDLRIAAVGFHWKSGGMGAAYWYGTGFEGARYLERGDGAILRWDPDSGELFHVVGGER